MAKTSIQTDPRGVLWPITKIAVSGGLLALFIAVVCSGWPDEVHAASQPVFTSLPPVLELRVDPSRSAAAAATPLQVRRGEELHLQLALANGQTWSQANVGRVVARQADGSQITLASSTHELQTSLAFRLEKPGPALIVTCSGASADGQAHFSIAGNTTCAKIIVDVQNSSGEFNNDSRGDAIVTSKAGGPIEIMPLRSPRRIRVGGELLVRAYFRNDRLADATLEAIAPSGMTALYPTNRGADARVRIDEAGLWRIRLRVQDGATGYLAELSFAIAQEAR